MPDPTMKIEKFAADLILTVSGSPLENYVVVTDENGTILSLDPLDQHDPASVNHLKGILTPGFVNTHCHLELSHLKGVAETGTGLLPFLTKVVSMREVPMEAILDAIEQADRDMYEAGIVAVGDISNKADTLATKQKSAIHYHTFVEMFDFLQDHLTVPTFEQYRQVFEQHDDQNGNKKSCVPHAPYTVSPGLFALINEHNPQGVTVSIHNQETPHENELFLNKGGQFVDWFQRFGFSTTHFQPIGKTSIHYAIQHMNPQHRTLFVHNTLTQPEDIAAAHAWNDQVYWATCANANLYIENRLPNYQHFMAADAKMTIGTDSLTSNWQLSVLEEMKTIARYQSYIPFETLLRWATLNGAAALGYEKQLGSIEPGKQPGLLLLDLDKSLQLTPHTRVKRLI